MQQKELKTSLGQRIVIGVIAVLLLAYDRNLCFNRT